MQCFFFFLLAGKAVAELVVQRLLIERLERVERDEIPTLGKR